MKNYLPISILFFIMLSVAGELFGQATLISDPVNARYCTGEEGVKLGVAGSEDGTEYVLQKNSGGWQQVSTIFGDGNTVWFPDNWTSGSYRLGPPYTNLTKFVAEDPYPQQIFNLTGGGGYCTGFSQLFPIGLDGSQAGVSYRLYRNGQFVLGTVKPGTGDPIQFGDFDQEGSYSAKANRNNCYVDMNGIAQIVEYDNPVANFSYSSSGPPDNCSTVEFENLSSGGTEPFTFQWNFGDGTAISADKNPVHNFPALGVGQQTYSVNLTIIDDNLCSHQYSTDVTVTRRPDAKLTGSGFPQFSFCDPDPNAIFQLTVTNISSTIVDNVYYWIDWYGDGSDVFESGPGFTTANHTYTTKGSFPLKFTIEGRNGCFDTKIYNVFNGSTALMGMQTGQLDGCAPFPIDFKMDPTVYNNTPSTVYTFDFGDGTAIETFLQEELPAADPQGYCVIPHTYEIASCGQPGNAFTMKALARNPCSDVPYDVGGIKISKKALASFDIFEFPNDPIYLCVGQPHTFFNYTDVGCLVVGGNSTTITSYSWDFGDNNSSNLDNPSHTYLLPGVYNVTLTAHTAQGIPGNCGTNISIRPVCVQDAPVASFTIDNITGCMPFEFTPINTSTAVGCASINYQWLVNPNSGYEYLNNTNPFSFQPDFNFFEAGEYTIQLLARTQSLATLCGEDYSDILTINVLDVPEISVVEGDYDMVCETGDFTFTVNQIIYNDNLSPITQYAWTVSPDGPVFNNNTLGYPTVTFNNYGTFQLKVIATNGCGDSQQATIELTINPDIEENSIWYDDDLDLCVGMSLGDLVLGSSPQTVPPLLGGDGVSYIYQWEIDEGSGWETVAGGTSFNLLYQDQLVHNPTKFRRKVNSGGCETYSDELLFTVHPAITNNTIINIQQQHICSGEIPQSLDGEAPSGGDETFTYLWEQSTDCNNPGSWVPAIGIPNNEQDYSPPSLTTTTCFRRIVYSVSDFCEDISNYVTVNVYGIIENNTILHPDPEICEGDSPGAFIGSLPTQTGHSLPLQYLWQKAVAPLWNWVDAGGTGQNFIPPPLNETTRYRRIVNAPLPVPANCNQEISNTIEIIVNQNPIVDAGFNQQIFNGGNVTLNGSAFGGTGDFTYLWTPADKIASGQGTPTVETVNLFAPPNLITFCLKVIDNQTTCWKEDCTNVTVFGELLECTATSNQTAICLGDQIILNASATGGSGIYVFTWSLPGGGTVSGASITHIPPGLGVNIYNVQVDDGANTSTCSVSVQVNALPVVNSSTSKMICSGQSVDYMPSADIPGTEFTWSSGNNPFITGNNAGDGIIDNVLFNSSNTLQTIIYYIVPKGPQPTLCQGSAFELVVSVNPISNITNLIGQQTVVSGQFSVDVVFESDVAGSSFLWNSSDDCPGLLSYTTPNSGNLLPSQQIEIIDPNGPETCIITFSITPTINDCPGVSFEYKIYVQQQPILFNVTGGGQVCDGGAVSIYLSGSQLGVNYQLLRNGTIPVQQEQIGTGNPLEWNGVSESGIYSIIGINQSNMVQAIMLGQVAVIVNPLPEVFSVVPQDDRCAPVVPLLSGSEAGVRYYLQRDGQDVQQLDGNGLPGFLIFEEQFIGGTYTIEAQVLSTLCEKMMQGSLNVHALPEDYPINPGGILCVGVTLFIEHSQPGIEYQLWLNDDPIGAIHVGDGDPIYFEQTTLPGNYRVLANDPVWLCDSFLSDIVVVNPTPLQYEVTPEVCCPGLCDIILNGWQPGVRYYLYFEDNAKQPKSIYLAGPFVGIPGEVNINFGAWWDEGTYTVVAKNDSECEIWMLNSTIIKAAPDIFNLTPNGTGCGSQEIILDGSEIDVEYFLYTDLQAEPSVIGTGFPLSFGIRDVTGVYTVKARFNHPEAECWSQMTGSYEITSFPTAFIVAPLPGTYCPCVNPTLSSSQLNINYYIQNETLGTESAAYPGTGNPMVFDPVCDPGSYIVYARHPDFPSCEKQMTGGFAIGLPPEKYNLSGPLPSAYCEGENGVTLTLDNSQDDVKYQLYKLPDIAEGNPKDGITGSSLTWENITAGEYFVEAVFANDPNCPTTMNNIVAVEEVSLPTVYAGDDGTICLSETYLVPNVVMTNQSSFLWTVETGNGSLSNATTPNPTYLPDQADAGMIIILKLEVEGISVCAGSSASDFISILIEPLPEIVSAGDNGLICFDQTYTVSNVTMNHVSNWVWTISSGNGALDDPALLNPTYTPGAGDAGTTIILTLETYGTLSCSNEIATGDVSIQIIAVPVVTSVTAQTICSGEAVNYMPLSDVPGTTFNWVSTNVTGGCVTGNSPIGSDIISNILINNCNTVQTIKYTITPFGPPTTNCEGTPVDLTVTINPAANITNNVSEQSINSGETSLEVVFQTDVTGTLVNYTWSGVASNPELQGWISDGTGDLPPMTIMIDETSPNPPDEAFVTYTVIPEVGGCAGNPFTYTIQVYLLPTIFDITVEGSGEFCNDGQSCIDITLNNSQPGKIYKLFLNGGYQNGIDKTGNGTAIQWCVDQAGIYTVRAQNPITGVEILMNGSAEVFARPIPNKFTLSIQQPGDYCTPITPRLNSSQVGAFYDLYRDGEIDPVQTDVPGTGNALLFESQDISGTYSVKAKIPYISIVCERQMDGLIIAEPLPVEYEVTPSDPFCEGENQICLGNSEIDVMYQLRKNGNPFGEVLTGTGSAICFPTITQNGNYRVFAKRTTGSLCEVLFEQQTIVRPLPSKFTLSPINSCPGTEIILNGCQPDVDYYLFLESAKSGNREWGQISGPLTCTLGEVNFGVCNTPGIYHVKAVDQLTNCFSWMQNSTTIFSEPTAYPVQPQGTAGCDPVEIYLNSFETDVTYYLWREFLGTTYPAGIDDGNDGIVNFGLKSEPGNYTIEAVVEHLSGITCGNWMEGGVSIATSPAIFTLKYEESLCLPVKFYLDGSESGVTYTLKKTVGTFSESIIGNGTPVYFTEVSLPGNYYVTADNGCSKEMINNWTVLDAPVSFLLTPEGGGFLCVDDNIQFGMTNSEANVTYYLYRIGNPEFIAMESILIGGPFVFSVANPFEPGTYRVQAINANGCKSWMADEKIIHQVPDKYNVTATKNGVLYLSGEYCPPVDIGLDYSEVGITYTLITPDNNDIILEGTGSSFTFGTFSSPGEYSVIAKNLATSCDSEMNGNVIISDGPAGFDLSCDEPKYCIGDTQAVTIILEDSQNGVEYQLYKGNLSNPVFPPQQGTGSNLTWNEVSQFGPGSYLIRGTFTSDPLCEAPMNNEIEVQELSLPTAAIGGDSIICEQSELHIPITLTGDQSWVVEYSCNNGIPESVTFDYEIGAPYFITVFPIESPSVYILESVKYAESPYCGGYVNEANFTVSLDTLPFAFAGNLGTTCENLPYLLFEADTAFSSVVSWQQTSGPAGVIENSFELNTSFICTENIQDISLVELLLIAQGRGQCSLQSDSSFVTIEIVPLPEPDAGDDATICASQSYLLAGTTNNGFSTSAFWEDLSGLGQFSDPNILNPTYTLISPESISAPVDVTLKLTEMGFGPCSLESVSSSVNIHLEPLPVCNAGQDTMMCANGNFQLLSQSLYFTTPQWVDLSGLGEFNDPNIPDPVYSLLDPGLITEPVSVALLLTVHGFGLCADEADIDTIYIQIDPLPQVYAGTDHTICVSDTIWITDYTVAFSSDTTWQIQQGFGQLLPPDQINHYPGYVPAIDDIGLVTGVFLELQGSGIGECTNEPVSDELIIFVNPMPFADAGADGVTCQTEDYQLLDANILNAIEDVLWEVVEGNGIIGEPSVLNTYYHPVAEDAGTTVKLRLTAFGVDACTSKQISDEMLIQIAPLPVLFAGSDAAICMTGSLEITDATALHYSTLLWSTSDGLGIFNPPDQLITTFTPDPLQGGSTVEIILSAFGTGNCLSVEVMSVPALIAVDSVPTIYPGADITTCLSAGPVEIIGASLNNYTSFWWLIHNGQGFGQLTNENSLSPIYNPDPRDTELIDGVKLRLSATGAGQCIAEVFDSIMTIYIDSLPVVFAGADAAICMNDLSYKILDAQPKYATNPQWTTINGSGTFSPPDAFVTTYTIGEADAGKIIELNLTVSGTGSCVDNFAFDALLLQVDSLPMAFAGSDGSTCVNSPYSLTNARSTHASSVKWDVVTGNGSFDDDLLINPLYTPGPGDESTTVLLQLTAFGKGMCNTEIHQSSVSVYVDPLPQVDAGSDDAICETETEYVISGASVNSSGSIFWTKTGGNGLFLNPDILTPSYQPALNDVGQTITFNLNAIGLGKCNDTTIIDSRTLKIGKKPEVRFFIIEDSISCAFSPTWFTDFSYTYFNEEIISRTWDFGDGPPITVSPETVVVSHKYETAGNKTVTLTINIAIDGIPLPACENSITKIIEVSPLPVVKFNYTQSNYCNGEVYFEDKSESNIEIVHWDFGDNQHAHENPIIHTYETPGDKIITLVVQDQNGCQDTLIETISVQEFFDFNILFEYAGICNEYKFWAENVLPSGNSIQDYFWTFGDGSDAVNQDTAVHEFMSSGQYDLVLKAIDSSGCLRIKDYIIDIPECPDNIAGQLFIPNAFDPEEVTPSIPLSPDSEYKVFLPKGQNITEYQIEVYDLWGNLLWQSSILKNGSPYEFWDGKYKNELVPAGSYLWKAFAKFGNEFWPGQSVNYDPNGKKFTTGTVTVIR